MCWHHRQGQQKFECPQGPSKHGLVSTRLITYLRLRCHPRSPILVGVVVRQSGKCKRACADEVGCRKRTWYPIAHDAIKYRASHPTLSPPPTARRANVFVSGLELPSTACAGERTNEQAGLEYHSVGLDNCGTGVVHGSSMRIVPSRTECDSTKLPRTGRHREEYAGTVCTEGIKLTHVSASLPVLFASAKTPSEIGRKAIWPA